MWNFLTEDPHMRRQNYNIFSVETNVKLPFGKASSFFLSNVCLKSLLVSGPGRVSSRRTKHLFIIHIGNVVLLSTS